MRHHKDKGVIHGRQDGKQGMGEAPSHRRQPPHSAAHGRGLPSASQASTPQEEVGGHSTGAPTGPQIALEPGGENQSNVSSRPGPGPHTTWLGPDAHKPPQQQMWWRGPQGPCPQPNQAAGGAPAQMSACLRLTWCWQTSGSSNTSCKVCGHLTCAGQWLHVLPCHLACTTQHSSTEHY